MMRHQRDVDSAPHSASHLTLVTPEQVAANTSTPGRTLGFLIGSVLLALGCAVVWTQFGPAFAREANILALVASGALAFAALYGLSRLAFGMPLRVLKFAMLVLVPVTAIYCWGASVTVYIDETPQLSSSQQAQAYVMLGDIYGDLAMIHSYTELINADQLHGRSRLREFGPAESELLEVSTKWDLTIAEMGELPDPNFIPIVAAVETAAYYQGQAVRARSLNLSSFDPQTREDMFSYQETVRLKIDEAGLGIAEIGPKYNFTLSDWKKD